MSGISPECATAIQNDIYIMTLDDHTPHGVLGGVSVEPSALCWKYAVEIIYRCLKVGYWRVWNTKWLEVHGIKDYYVFCKKLAELNPYDLSEEGEQYWLEPFLCSTELSADLVRRFNVANTSNTYCQSLINEVEVFFAENNVAWGEEIFSQLRGDRSSGGNKNDIPKRS
ncbi:hypothetical protein [Pseudomonas alabamensis]|uniref:hypothetical protein n=1 Tax=Pseudomonas alabamensis TaxID=3064349 RepID=UPI003F64E859